MNTNFEKGLLPVLCRPAGFWSATGIYKPKGVTLLIEYVDGTWQPNKYWEATNAAGNSLYIAGDGYLCPGVPEGSLICKLGGDINGGGGAPFVIGVFGFVPADYEGQVFLTVNDHVQGFGDNVGSIRVSVTLVEN